MHLVVVNFLSPASVIAHIDERLSGFFRQVATDGDRIPHLDINS